MLISMAIPMWLLGPILHCFKNLPAKVHTKKS